MDDEIFPIVDVAGNILGKATRKECHSGSMLLHPVVHLHIVDRTGRIFLQKRSGNKDIQPGRWDTAVGGHVDFGECVSDALVREAREELGIKAENYFHLISYDFKSDCEYELINSYCMIVDSDEFKPKYCEDEISDVRFWTTDEIQDAEGRGILTPNFESEFKKVKDYIYSKL